MRISVLSRQKFPDVLRRIQSLGWRIQADPSNRIQGLSARSSDRVYLVPIEETRSPQWPETRVRLAQSSRFYVVFGAALTTAAIVEAARDGAHDVVDNTDSDERWASAIESAAKSQALWWQLYGAREESDDENLIGHSRSLQSIRESISRIGPTPATVLITGESGTGKERVAEAIHAASGRDPFVTVNCAAIPAELMESELFGVEKGAYTGANQSRIGLVEEAATGTLFLDEIGEMDISLQPKLLRFLETHKARRVGSSKEYTCLARVISATNRDLKTESESGRFRLDLYYRLCEVGLELPPLRHRTSDIPDLVKSFMAQAAERLGKNFETIEPELLYKFQAYRWPGNIRELKQTIDRIAIHYNGPVIRAAWWDRPDLSTTENPKDEITRAPQHPALQSNAPTQERYPTQQPMLPPALANSEGLRLSRKQRRDLARQLLEESGNDLSWVAARLGIHPTTLYRWRKAGEV